MLPHTLDVWKLSRHRRGNISPCHSWLQLEKGTITLFRCTQCYGWLTNRGWGRSSGPRDSRRGWLRWRRWLRHGTVHEGLVATDGAKERSGGGGGEGEEGEERSGGGGGEGEEGEEGKERSGGGGGEGEEGEEGKERSGGGGGEGEEGEEGKERSGGGGGEGEEWRGRRGRRVGKGEEMVGKEREGTGRREKRGEGRREEGIKSSVTAGYCVVEEYLSETQMEQVQWTATQKTQCKERSASSSTCTITPGPLGQNLASSISPCLSPCMSAAFLKYVV